jgi:transposase-like protein
MGGKKKPGKPGRGASGKTPVVGAIERDGRVVTMVTRTVSQNDLTGFIAANVNPNATVFTDDFSGYGRLTKAGFKHLTISHAQGFYADGDTHTQNIESFWSLIKRTLKGTYVSVEAFHLHRYLTEYGFRFDNRRVNDGLRFIRLASQVSGKRLTYKQLTGKELATGA